MSWNISQTWRESDLIAWIALFSLVCPVHTVWAGKTLCTQIDWCQKPCCKCTTNVYCGYSLARGKEGEIREADDPGWPGGQNCPRAAPLWPSVGSADVCGQTLLRLAACPTPGGAVRCKSIWFFWIWTVNFKKLLLTFNLTNPRFFYKNLNLPLHRAM